MGIAASSAGLSICSVLYDSNAFQFWGSEQYVRDVLDRGERLMGFGHRIYRAEDPRARVLRRTSRDLSSKRFEVAEALERAALAELSY